MVFLMISGFRFMGDTYTTKISGVNGAFDADRVRSMKAFAILAIALGLAGCTDPYDPGQRAIGGGLLGAGAGAAIGAAAGGGPGAATGALIGGAVGAVGGAVTTPQRPPSTVYVSPPAPPPTYYVPPPTYYAPPPPAYVVPY